MRSIDLNCDLGEGYPNDDALLDLITSANIACGFHAGDEASMRHTAETAQKKGVAIGAHPSFPDRENFGRTNMQLSTYKVYEFVTIQIEKMLSVCDSIGTRLNHVKPHGALYNMAAKDAGLAETIARAVLATDPSLVLYGLSGSNLISEAKKVGLTTASEVFADRTYTRDGSLTPRSDPNALIEDTQQAVDQVLQMVRTSTVTATTADNVTIEAETICIHGDGPHAVEFAKVLRDTLESNGIQVTAVHR